MERKRVYLKIFGQVQGVSYRYYTQKKAARLGLKGWVKNEPDGTVTIQAEGTKKDIEKLIQWSYQGPSFAQVEKVDLQWEDYQGNLSEFEIRF